MDFDCFASSFFYVPYIYHEAKESIYFLNAHFFIIFHYSGLQYYTICFVYSR